MPIDKKRSRRSPLGLDLDCNQRGRSLLDRASIRFILWYCKALRIVWATSSGQISCIRVKEATVLFVCGKCFPLQNVHNVFFSWSTCFKRWTMFINHSRNLVVSGNIQRTITDPAAQCLIYSFIKQLQLSGADLRVNQLVRLRLLRNSLSVTKGPLRRIITTSVCKFYTEKTTKQNQDSLNKTAPPLSTNIFTIFFPLVKKKNWKQLNCCMSSS